jgi:hypothetical protein
MSNNIRLIEIIGHKWFDRVNGNTYHSTKVLVHFDDGTSKSACSGFTYGYGDSYADTGKKMLREAGYLPTDVYAKCAPCVIYAKDVKKRDLPKAHLWG